MMIEQAMIEFGAKCRTEIKQIKNNFRICRDQGRLGTATSRLDASSHIIYNSSLLRASWGGCRPPSPLLFVFAHHLQLIAASRIRGGCRPPSPPAGCRPPNPPLFVFAHHLQLIASSRSMGGAAAPQLPRWFNGGQFSLGFCFCMIDYFLSGWVAFRLLWYFCGLAPLVFRHLAPN